MSRPGPISAKYSNSLLFVLGLFLRLINKVRHLLMGYTSPRPATKIRDFARDAAYTLTVVRNWEHALREYTGEASPFRGKHVLELGPGPDLGTGIVILALGAASFTAIDKYRLISGRSTGFYQALFGRLRDFPDAHKARQAWYQFQRNRSCAIFSYLHSPAFRLKERLRRKYDLLVSQAVLEHIDDIEAIFTVIKAKLGNNACMVHEVDLGTHTRWLRDADPLNLLRYPQGIYNLLKFSGAPNRLRMSDYHTILQKSGYRNIRAVPLTRVEDAYLQRVNPALAGRFRGYSAEDLAVRSFHLLAGKGRE